MPEVTLGSSALLLNLAELALRAWLIVTGLLVAGHYHCMANFLGRAPHLIRALALPTVTGAGIGMAFCGAVGATLQGALFGAAAAGLMAGINLAAWGAGAYVSAQLERAAEVRAQIKRDGWAFVRQFDQLAETARALDSDRAPLADNNRPERQAHHERT